MTDQDMNELEIALELYWDPKSTVYRKGFYRVWIEANFDAFDIKETEAKFINKGSKDTWWKKGTYVRKAKKRKPPFRPIPPSKSKLIHDQALGKSFWGKPVPGKFPFQHLKAQKDLDNLVIKPSGNILWKGKEISYNEVLAEKITSGELETDYDRYDSRKKNLDKLVKDYKTLKRKLNKAESKQDRLLMDYLGEKYKRGRR